MGELDPAAADGLRILLSAAAGAIAGGLVSEWRAGKAETRALAREQAAEVRADQRDGLRLRRDQMLRRIEDTRSDLKAELNWLMYRALGANDRMLEVHRGPQYFPDALLYLVGDEDLLRRYMDFTDELLQRQPGSGMSDQDTGRMGALVGHIGTALDVQRDRVSRGNAPTWPSTAFVQEAIDRMGDRFGVPAEFRPKVNLDAVDPPL